MYNRTMDDAKMEAALLSLVRMLFLLIPYSVIMLILGNSYLQPQLLMLMSFFLVGATSFFIELFMKFIIEQDFIGKVVYIVLIGGMLLLSYLLIMPSFLFLSGNKTDLSSVTISVVHIYLVLYWIYLGIKGFYKAVWELDAI